MIQRAKFSVGVPLGLLFVGLIVALDGWLLNRLLTHHIRTEELNFLSFTMGLVVLLSVPLLLFLVYQVVSCLTLRYHLDRNGIIVRWAGTEQIIPIRDVERIVHGSQLGDAIVRRRGLRWPGHERGTGQVPGIGRTTFLATRPLGRQLLLVTPGQAFSAAA